jgi:hypothetical protein
MADYVALKNEILNDPLSLGYAGKADSQVAALMNGASRPTTTSRTTIDACDVFEAIDPVEWSALNAANQTRVNAMLAMGRLNVNGTNTRAVFGAVFTGAASPITRAALLALQTVAVPRSRAQEIFGVAVTDLDIAKARAS